MVIVVQSAVMSSSDLWDAETAERYDECRRFPKFDPLGVRAVE
jgi:hypothetical protein